MHIIQNHLFAKQNLIEWAITFQGKSLPSSFV